jgi:hypothetical protein
LSKLDLGDGEPARHEELVSELHLVHVDLDRGFQPSSQADDPHGGLAPGEFLEASAQRT